MGYTFTKFFLTYETNHFIWLISLLNLAKKTYQKFADEAIILPYITAYSHLPNKRACPFS